MTGDGKWSVSDSSTRGAGNPARSAGNPAYSAGNPTCGAGGLSPKMVTDTPCRNVIRSFLTLKKGAWHLWRYHK